MVKKPGAPGVDYSSPGFAKRRVVGLHRMLTQNTSEYTVLTLIVFWFYSFHSLLLYLFFCVYDLVNTITRLLLHVLEFKDGFIVCGSTGSVFIHQPSLFLLLYRFSLGSSASRRPSPSRLNARTVIMMNKPGNVIKYGALREKSFAPDIKTPHSGCTTGTPKPR